MNDGQIPTMSKQVRMIKLMQEVFSTNIQVTKKVNKSRLSGCFVPIPSIFGYNVV